MFITGRLNKQPTKVSTAVTETIVLTALGLIFGFWFAPDRPFFSLLGFSWLTLGPFLAGLRYGFAYSFNSALFLIILMWGASEYYPPWQGLSFTSTTVSLVFFALCAGEFRNYWYRQTLQLKAAAAYSEQRLEQVSKAFNLLRISHDKLEQQIASRRSLRDSILAVRRHIMKAQITDAGIAELSSLILRVFADYVSVQQAGLFDIQAAREKNHFNLKILAFIGGAFEVNMRDQLLLKAMATKKTHSLKVEAIAEKQYQDTLLLAIPLVDVFGNFIGLALVNKMPFRAFRADNIQLASILAGHIADIISIRSASQPLKDIELQNFTVHLMRCLEDVRSYAISGCLVAIQLTDKQRMQSIYTLITSGQRGLDYSWTTKNRNGEIIIFILLPLTDLAGVQGYRVRLKKMVMENYAFDNLEQAGILLHVRDLKKGDQQADTLMSDFFIALNIDAEIWQDQE